MSGFYLLSREASTFTEKIENEMKKKQWCALSYQASIISCGLTVHLFEAWDKWHNIGELIKI